MKRTGFPLNSHARQYALTGALFGLLFPVFATVVYLLDSGAAFTFSSIIAAHASEPLFWIIDTAPIFLGIFAWMAGRRQDDLDKFRLMLEVKEKALEFAQLEGQQRINQLTYELTAQDRSIIEHADQLKSVVDISRSMLSIQDLDELLSLLVKETGKQFKCHHVRVYLLDEKRQHAMLVASRSEKGAKILGGGQNLKMGEKSLVEFVIQSGQARLVNDADPIHSPTIEFANILSELVLPLKSGQISIGALDLLSETANGFDEEQISVLSILADLATIAIQNSISYEKTQQSLREVEASSKQTSTKLWESWLQSVQVKGYRYDGIKSEPLKGEKSSSSQNKLESIPIRLRGQTIGSLRIKMSEPSHDWIEDDRAIAEAVAERAALALEGARLLDEAKKRAAREAFLSDLAAKLSTSFQLDSILRDTVEELGQTLEGAAVSFQLVDPTAQPGIDSLKPSESPVPPQDVV